MSGSNFEKPDDDRLYRDPQLVDFYDLENSWSRDDDYCLALAASASSVLDLGCGTGRLATRLASENRVVIGVDPANAMLDVARAKNFGVAVTWIEGDARELRLDREFDLVLLTGHAFQVFLNETDQRAVLKTIANHLAPNGCFIFDSRNPLAKEWLEWGQENSKRKLVHPQHGIIDAWNTAQFDPSTNNLMYSTNYLVLATGKLLTAESHIHFTPRSKLANMIEECGLEVEQWLGDWAGNSYEAHSPEIIPIGRLQK